jgi:hypothetical protein
LAAYEGVKLFEGSLQAWVDWDSDFAVLELGGRQVMASLVRP